MLNSSSTPILSPYASLKWVEDKYIVETQEATYAFSARSAEIFATVGHKLNGLSNLAELAKEADVSPAELNEILIVLAKDGVLVNTTAPCEESSPDKFLEYFFSLCRFWSKEIFAQLFWKTLLSGCASRSLVLGWGIEFYHYVESANEHMSAAVAYCRNDSLTRQWLAKHYSQEYNHSSIFLEGLVESGLDRQQTCAAPPLPSTRALINYLKELAISDTIAYMGTFAIVQSPGTREEFNQSYNLLIAQYPFASSLFNSFRNHAALDIELGHQELHLIKLCTREDVITKAQAKSILAAARGLVEHWILFFEGIYEFYNVPNIPLTRPLLDIRLFL